MESEFEVPRSSHKTPEWKCIKSDLYKAMVAFCAWTVCMVSLQAVADAGRVKSPEKQ